MIRTLALMIYTTTAVYSIVICHSRNSLEAIARKAVVRRASRKRCSLFETS